MATATTKSQCSVCNKEISTFNCDGCLQKFCWNDLNKHRQSLGEQFDHIESDHDQFRQTLIDQKNDSKTHSLIKQVDQWETISIEKIKQTAEECRQKLLNYINPIVTKLENKLNDLAKQIKDVRGENEFNEIDLNRFRQKLTELEYELTIPSNVSIRQEPTSFINKIYVSTPLGEYTNVLFCYQGNLSKDKENRFIQRLQLFHLDRKWKKDGITIVGANGRGNQLNQLDGPRSIFIDDDQILYIADSNNQRILEWKSNAKNGRVVAGGNGKGKEINQLDRPSDVIIDSENNSLIISDRYNRRIIRWPRDNNTTNGEIIISDIDCRSLAMDKDGSLYVCDSKKNEVRRWKRGEKDGTIVAGGNGEGDQLNQLNYPSYIFIDDDYSLYISDDNNHRLMRWLKDAEEGIVVVGGNGQENDLTQLSSPQRVIVDQFGQIFMTDWDNHRVMLWLEGKKEGTIIVGGNGKGKEPNQFSNPQGLSFDREGNLYVVDVNNSRIQKFKIDFD